MKTIFISFLVVFVINVSGQTIMEKPTENSNPFVLGRIEQIHSKELNEDRILNIYLPEGYNQKDTIKYPVMYLLDGSANEDFIHIVGLVQFYSFEWIHQLPKLIVVGISTVDRRRDFTYPTNIEEDKKRYPTTGHSGKFISFIQNELQPFIDKKYNTNYDKTIIGQSLGGLLATEILLTHTSFFNRYIIVSPSLWWDNSSLLQDSTLNLLDKISKQTDIYIGVGKEGLTPTRIPRVMEVDANVLADKLSALKAKKLKIDFDYLPLENHATIMHQAVANAFKLLYPLVSKE